VLKDKAGTTILYNINGGFAEVLNNKVAVLVEGAVEI
jgi:F0F1-type ATP synthase epsilon subunit